MTLTRTALAALAALALAGGCKKPAARSKPTPAGAQPPVAAAVPSPAAAAAPSPAAGRAEAVAGDSLKAINDGTATPAMLTPQFKRLVAEPVFEADRAGGFSDHGAEAWLGQLKGKLPAANRPAAPVIGSAGDAVGYVGAVGGPTRWTAYALRLVRSGDGYLVDWFDTVPVDGYKNSFSDSPASFPAVAFLQVVLAKDAQLAAGLMSPALKARLAPPFESDKAVGYNRGLLTSRLTDLCGPATGYRLDKVEGPVASAWLSGGGPDKAVTLKFVKGERPWDWLVDDIEVK